MKFVGAFFVFAIAVISINTVNGTSFYGCPPQKEKIVYVYYCPYDNNNGNTAKDCYYPPCNATNSYEVCGSVDGRCMSYKCLNALYNDGCAMGKNIENVNLKYCTGLKQGAGYQPCSKY